MDIPKPKPPVKLEQASPVVVDHVEPVKKPFVFRPHLTHTLKSHPGLAALRKQATEDMRAAREQSKKNHPSNQNR